MTGLYGLYDRRGGAVKCEGLLMSSEQEISFRTGTNHIFMEY